MEENYFFLLEIILFIFIYLFLYSPGPLHQSEEELLSPNEDFGPEARSAHRKLLTIGQHQQRHPESPDQSSFFFFNNGEVAFPHTPLGGGPIPDAAAAAHYHHHHLDEHPQFLIPPPSNLGFSGSSTDGDDLDHLVVNGSMDNHPPNDVYSNASTSSTTTTGCLIAAATAEINQAAEGVITPSTSGATPTPTPTTTTTTESSVCESEQFSYPTISAATATLTGAVLGGDLPGDLTGATFLTLNPTDQYYYYHHLPGAESYQTEGFDQFQQPQQQQSSVKVKHRRRHHRRHRRHRKGHISLVPHHPASDSNQLSSDQASDIAPLDLSPGDSISTRSTSTTSTASSSSSSSSELSRSDLSDSTDSDSDQDRASTIRRRISTTTAAQAAAASTSLDKSNNSNEIKMLATAQVGSSVLGLGPQGGGFKPSKAPKNSKSFDSSFRLFSVAKKSVTIDH